MNDDTQNGTQDNGTHDPRENTIWQRLRDARANADRGREPELLQARQGRRQYSMRALVERIVTQFLDEHGTNSEALQAADTETDRLKLVLASADYVIAVESVELSAKDKADVVRQAYGELFSYGPLDKLLADESVTTIALEGADKLSVRRRYDDILSETPLFDDEAHLHKIMRRMLADAGAELREDEPVVETGLTVNGRRVSLTVVSPPASTLLTADIRVHPATPPSLDDLVADETITADSARLLEALAVSEHGVMVIGDTESGKTTMLGLLARLAHEGSGAGHITSVERSAELALPEDVSRHTVRWRTSQHERLPLADCVKKALAEHPNLLLVDEVRADDAAAIAPLLLDDGVPRQMWAFRGQSESKRQSAALSMLARRSAPDAGETPVHNLYERLPFIVTLRRRFGKLMLSRISEWQHSSGATYPDHIDLMAVDWDNLVLTGQRPVRPLPLPDDFWNP